MIFVLFMTASFCLKLLALIIYATRHTSEDHSAWRIIFHFSLACDIVVVLWIVMRKEEIKACLVRCGEDTDEYCSRSVDKSSCKKTTISLLFIACSITLVVLVIIKFDMKKHRTTSGGHVHRHLRRSFAGVHCGVSQIYILPVQIGDFNRHVKFIYIYMCIHIWEISQK